MRACVCVCVCERERERERNEDRKLDMGDKKERRPNNLGHRIQQTEHQ